MCVAYLSLSRDTEPMNLRLGGQLAHHRGGNRFHGGRPRAADARRTQVRGSLRARHQHYARVHRLRGSCSGGGV
jgi:hypothetical protein